MRVNKKSFQEERHIRFKEGIMKETIGFIGAGNMGKAMIEGICQNHVFNTVWVCDHHQENLDVLHEKYGVETSLSEIEVAQNSDVFGLKCKAEALSKVD